MASGSAIEWTDATWTVVTGCDVISPACAHCYAREFAPRLQKMERARRADPAVPAPGEKYQTDSARRSSGVGFEVVCHEHLIDWPHRLRRGRRIFVTSMGDLFHDRVPAEFIARVFATMAATPRHTYQVLTKRHERLRALISADSFAAYVQSLVPDVELTWPLANVWLGVTIENRSWVRRADFLRDTPAAVRFISAEPLLGPLVNMPRPVLDLSRIDWVIAGGESGAKARRLDPDLAGGQWVRELRDACRAAGTAFFFKQWGGRTPKAGGRELDGRTWDEFPATGAAA